MKKCLHDRDKKRKRKAYRIPPPPRRLSDAEFRRKMDARIDGMGSGMLLAAVLGQALMRRMRP